MFVQSEISEELKSGSGKKNRKRLYADDKSDSMTPNDQTTNT
jgi:hypothetical protein